MKKLLSTAIAYANAGPHIGHAFEFVLADTIARYQKKQDDVFFVTGMDEHGQKIEQKAKEMGADSQSFVDANANLFKELDEKLSVDYDFFVRTSDREKHHKGAEILWNKLAEKGDIVLREYEAMYCVGCEEFKTDKDLNENGECSIHLKKPDLVKEKNYFFLLSRYTEEIKKKILSDELKIVPETRKNEIVALLERGLEDVSFSRSKEKVSWGIPVPGDDTQTMYVWCDALSNYITAIGYGTDHFDEERAKEMTHVIGKDILRFHAAIWPGMLLSAGLPLPKEILVHGFITSGGQKMSKSLGNVISPEEVIESFKDACTYPGEALRFILLQQIPSFDDGDLTVEGIKTIYSSYLSNGIGNLVSRVCTMIHKYSVETSSEAPTERISTKIESFNSCMEGSDVKRAVEVLTTWSQEIDERIAREEPFKLIKTDEVAAKEILREVHSEVLALVRLMQFIMPRSMNQAEGYLVASGEVKPLFNRLA